MSPATSHVCCHRVWACFVLLFQYPKTSSSQFHLLFLLSKHELSDFYLTQLFCAPKYSDSLWICLKPFYVPTCSSNHPCSERHFCRNCQYFNPNSLANSIKIRLKKITNSFYFLNCSPRDPRIIIGLWVQFWFYTWYSWFYAFYQLPFLSLLITFCLKELFHLCFFGTPSPSIWKMFPPFPIWADSK